MLFLNDVSFAPEYYVADLFYISIILYCVICVNDIMWKIIF